MTKKKKKVVKKTTTTEPGELTLLDKISQEVGKKIKENFEIVLVSSKKDLELAGDNIKTIKKRKKEYTDSINPLKKFLNGLHKKVTSAEKENVLVYDKSIDSQEDEISIYKEKLYEEQKKAEEKAQKLADKKAADERKMVLIEARHDASRLRREATIKEKQGATLKEIEALRSEADEIRADAEDFDPGINPVKVVLEKDRIKKDYDYYIRNEPAFIDWALNNDLNLLKISVNKSAFNGWVKRDDNFNHPFVGKNEVMK